MDKASGATGTLAIDRIFSEQQLGQKPELIRVATITLDEALEAPHLKQPDLLKIDVEMAEHLVFRGANRLLTEVQPVLIFECASHNRKECLDVLAKKNYRVLNADEPDSGLDNAKNFLAIPQAQQQHFDDLLIQWRIEHKEWNK